MLPISRVILFQHGVGYFERSGTVEGNQSIELLFRIDQMNDVLKSLTTIDLDGGTFSVLNYDSEEPIEKQLENINFEITEKNAISSFLGQLKGTEVIVPRSSGEARGVIIGIEKVNRKIDDSVVEESYLAMLADGSRLLRIPLLETSEITFIDDVVAKDLNKLLEIYHANLYKNRKKLTITTKGEGTRRIILSYVVEVPAWKTSYRMVLPEFGNKKTLLQGWALVDNTSEDDWNQVALSLVSGLPVSFVHDLYTPRYRKRPVVDVDLEAAAYPEIIERKLKSFEGKPDVVHNDLSVMNDIIEDVQDDENYNSSRYMHLKKIKESIKIQAETREMGELFSYDVSGPVDINSGCSALVPFLNTESDSERVLIYNPKNRKKNPMAAVLFKNTTGLTLEKGPVTIIESDCYAGEAMMDYLSKNDDCIIPYAVELRVELIKNQNTKKHDYQNILKRGHIIYKIYEELLITTYSIKSKLDHEVLLYLDHSFKHVLDANTAAQPAEITENYWRYKIKLLPQSEDKLEVVEVAIRYESIEMDNVVKKEIYQLHDKKLISDNVRNELEKIADQVHRLKIIKGEYAKCRDMVAEIMEGQNRLRENLTSIGNTSEEVELRRKYVAKLSAEEEQIEKLKTNIKDLEKQVKKDKRTLSKMIEELKIV